MPSFQLRIALQVEGNTDERFLPALIYRVTLDILAKRQQIPVDVLPLEIIEPVTPTPSQTGAENILHLAQKAADYNILIIHKDVDKRTWQAAYRQMIEPGLKKVETLKQQEPEMNLCRHIVPLLPQHEVEAWVLADEKTLRQVIGTKKSAANLGLPKLKVVERPAGPKEILVNAVRVAIEARPNRRRSRSDVGELLNGIYSRMGEEANLEMLKELSSFQKFESALTGVLQELGLIA